MLLKKLTPSLTARRMPMMASPAGNATTIIPVTSSLIESTAFENAVFIASVNMYFFPPFRTAFVFFRDVTKQTALLFVYV